MESPSALAFDARLLHNLRMATGFVHDERFLEHDTGKGHPERPDRLRAVMKQLDEFGLMAKLHFLSFEPAPREIVERLHESKYIDRLQDACDAGEPFIDSVDSAICPRSAEIAYLAAGGAIAATNAVMTGEVANAFCAMRPPGHHAEADRSMGFCFFDNVALAADHAIREHGIERVAIVDFDVHHGNGTQHLFELRPDILFISLHQHPRYLYPGTGFDHETGMGAGVGATLNVPLMPGGGDDIYREAFELKVLPKLDTFAPQALFISAGFDAAKADPLAHMEVSTDGFRWMTQVLVGLANKHCGGRIVSVLEGGYDLTALAEGVATHVDVLIEAGT